MQFIQWNVNATQLYDSSLRYTHMHTYITHYSMCIRIYSAFWLRNKQSKQHLISITLLPSPGSNNNMLPLAYDFCHIFFICLCVFSNIFSSLSLSLYVYRLICALDVNPFNLASASICPFSYQRFSNCQQTDMPNYARWCLSLCPLPLILLMPFGCAQFSLSFPEFSWRHAGIFSRQPL